MERDVASRPGADLLPRIRSIATWPVAGVLALALASATWAGFRYRANTATRAQIASEIVSVRFDGARAAVFDVPPVPEPTARHDHRDWEGRALCIGCFFGREKIRADRVDVRTCIGWSREGLFVRLRLRSGSRSGGKLPRQVRLVLEIGGVDGSRTKRYWAAFSPQAVGRERLAIFDPSESVLRAGLGATARTLALGQGEASVEAVLPLGSGDLDGRRVPFNAELTYATSAGLVAERLWGGEPSADAALRPVLRLAGRASSPVEAAAVCVLERSSGAGRHARPARRDAIGALSAMRAGMGAWVKIAASPGLARGALTLRSEEGRNLGVMVLDESGLGEMRLPAPLVGRIDLCAGGRKVGECFPQLPTRSVASRPIEARPIFESYVFDSAALPEVLVSDPFGVREALGEYRVYTSYYDARGRRVTRAPTPGRYGAVTRVATEGGDVFVSYTTLYRRGPRSSPLLPHVPIPRLGREETRALELASSEGGPPRAGEDDRYAAFDRNLRWWIGLRERIGFRYPCLVTLPTDYWRRRTFRWPVVIYCHGGGAQDLKELGRNLETEAFTKVVQGGAGPFSSLGPPTARRKLPFVVIEPELSLGDLRWTASIVRSVLREQGRRYRLDPDRVILTGYSSGTTGAWRIVLDDPGLFAAFVPVAGERPGSAAAKRVGRLPIWFFHGMEDKTISPSSSSSMAREINLAGGNARLTLLPGVAHDSPQKVWQRGDLWKWMLLQRRRAR